MELKENSVAIEKLDTLLMDFQEKLCEFTSIHENEIDDLSVNVAFFVFLEMFTLFGTAAPSMQHLSFIVKKSWSTYCEMREQY